MKTASEIRDDYLKFFESKQHHIVPSAPVVPQNDPTLYFTNAGMNQFKDIFLGTGHKEHPRVADTQKCIRVSGKHNDLEEVGVDTYHHTFFEMLGNWSFGDYFKKDAIKWAAELLIEVWGIPKEKLWVSVFAGDTVDGLEADEEAAEIWVNEVGISPERVLRLGKKDNFWEMGETGPCGPCSEILVNNRDIENPTPDELMEIWNLVFIQYNRHGDGKLVTLPEKHVDTGMGLERIVAFLQNKESNYDTDLFTPIIEAVAARTNLKYEGEESSMKDIAFRVIADHIRTLCVAFADGVLPQNTGRGYVMRRILRRAVRYGRQGLHIEEPFLHDLVPTVAKMYKGIFPEIAKREEHIRLLIEHEEKVFRRTLERGIGLFEELAKKVIESKSTTIPGDKAYRLYHQDGFPRDLVDLMAREKKLVVDNDGWVKAEQKHQEESKGKKAAYEFDMTEIEGLPATKFVGYSKVEGNARTIKMVDTDKLILDETPFYAESGGQIGDTGVVCSKNFRFEVHDTQKFGDIIIHIGELVEGDLGKLPENVTAYVDKERRRLITANHSATHLLHWALRKVLGDHVTQQGSLVASDKLRFDISHPQKVTDAELTQVETLVNELICENISVRKNIEPREKAIKQGAMALFGEKYGEKVRVVSIGKYSKELCGGVHVYATGDIGSFRIVNERPVQAGVRRIEAITRLKALSYSQSQHSVVEELKDLLKTHSSEELTSKVKALQAEIKELKKKEAQKSQQDSRKNRDDMLRNAPLIGEVKVVLEKLKNVGPDEMRGLSDMLRQQSSAVAGLVASEFQGKAFLFAFASKKAIEQGLHAGELIGKATEVIGGGGNRKRNDFAQGQGPGVEKLGAMLKELRGFLENKLS